MSDLRWQGIGPERSLVFGSVSLLLNVEKANPGLEWFDDFPYRVRAQLLGLFGLSQTGRYDTQAFSGQSLVGWDAVRGRLQATYRPAGWEGLTIRGLWSPTSVHEGVDLEIQASAGSSATLRQVEVDVSSRWHDGDSGGPPTPAIRIEPRDAQAAAHTYDGREPASMAPRSGTLPVGASQAGALRPLVVPAGRALYYVEMVHPHDVARRIVGIPEEGGSGWQRVHRYCLLGHDIEKGVVLRARLRGLWIQSDTPEQDAEALYGDFLREPPPLGP